MSIQVTGIDEAAEAIDRVSAEMADPGPRLEVLASRVVALVEESISEGVSPDGSVWAPRKATTVRRAGGKSGPRTASPGQLGRITGAMAGSVSLEVDGPTAVVSVNSPHARFFSLGTSRQPARKLLPEASEGPAGAVLDEWTEETADALVEAADG